MNIQIGELEDKEKTQWNSFVSSHLYATPYDLWEYGQVLSETYGYRRYYLAAKYGENIAGILPLVSIKSSLFGSKLLSLPFCEYGGPLTDPRVDVAHSIAKALLDGLRVLASRLNVDYAEIRNPYLNKGIFNRRAYRSIRKYLTFVVDLSGNEESLWFSIDKKTRNVIRKAIKSSVRVLRVVEDSQLRKYYPLYLMTQKSHGSPPHTYSFFSNILKNMKRNVRILLATYHNVPIAGIIAFYDKRRIYWWNSVSNPEFKSLNATSMLLWHIIRWGRSSNHLSLSLGRTRVYEGTYHFKKNWGGKETPYMDYVYSSKHEKVITPDPSEGKYRFLTKLWSSLPIPMSELLGPSIIKQVGL